MSVRMKDLLDRFASMQKAAEETLAAQPGALVGVKDIPGSEHDAKVPEEAKKPNPEVTQGQPAGATTAEGAVSGGDAKPLNEGKLEVDQTLVNPVKKPEITDDALTAKEASAHLGKLVSELLSDISAGKAKAQKQAAAASVPDQAKTEGQEKAAQEEKTQAIPTKSEGETKPAEQKDGEKTATAKTEAPKIELNNEMLSKLAAAVATFTAGRKAAEDAIQKAAAAKQADKTAGQAEKTAAEKRMAAIRIVKEACVKAAQEAGLDPAAADAAATAAMADAGVSAEDAAAAKVDAGAAAADAGAAGAAGAAAADAGAAGAAGAGDVQIPEDVTEEEIANAILDCVQSGELDVDTAKALVNEIAGDAGGITEDQAAEVIATSLQNGEITPEQAQELIATIESGAGDAGAAGGEAAAGAEAAGAADAAQAAQDAAEEAKGAADAEAAVKQAADALRASALQKVASAIVAKREQIKQAAAQPKVSPLTAKVASILNARKAAQDAQAEKTASEKTEGQKYLEGFCKKAAELGVDPQKLAQYILATKAQAQAK